MLKKIKYLIDNISEKDDQDKTRMSRRSFLFTLPALIAVPKLIVEAKPIADIKTLTINGVPAYDVEQAITLKSYVREINYSIFDVENFGHMSQFMFLEAKNLTDVADKILRKHDRELFRAGRPNSRLKDKTTMKTSRR